MEEYMKRRHQGTSFVAGLKQRLLLPQDEALQAGTRYNVPLINSLVLYIGMQTIQQLLLKMSAPLGQQLADNAAMEIYLLSPALDIFKTLITDLDMEGRYLFLNAIANQLRYPNNHTCFFSYTLLFLFVEAAQKIIREQVTQVLFERLIVSPHNPRCLLITFMELIKENVNPRYKVWDQSFTTCEPEISKRFMALSRSCGGPRPVDESIVSGRISDNVH